MMLSSFIKVQKKKIQISIPISASEYFNVKRIYFRIRERSMEANFEDYNFLLQQQETATKHLIKETAES